MADKKLSEKQIARMEKMRLAREANQKLLKDAKDIKNRLDVLETVGTVYHDEGISYTRYRNQINDLRNSWPELFDKLNECFGVTPW